MQCIPRTRRTRNKNDHNNKEPMQNTIKKRIIENMVKMVQNQN